MPTDVTDLTFEQDVLERSDEHPVIVDLWAPWCGPCKTLGPILEKLVDESAGAVELVKVNVDENPQISQAFQVQSIPAVYALSGRKVVDGFIGALPEAKVREFLGKLVSAGERLSEVDELIAAGDEHSLRHALELEPDKEEAVTALAELLIEREELDEATRLLDRIPDSAPKRHVSALLRLSKDGAANLAGDELEGRLNALLENVKNDDQARQEFLDLLETMDAEDPRRSTFRRALASRIY